MVPRSRNDPLARGLVRLFDVPHSLVDRDRVMGKPGRPPKDPAKAALKLLLALSQEDREKVLFAMEFQREFSRQAELASALKIEPSKQR